MSVATQLGLDDPDTDLLAAARAQWPVWCTDDPRLHVVDDLLELPGWIAATDKAGVDDVLCELARLASPTGGDDVTAAGALAWVLLPGACVVAHRLANLTPRIDEIVAAQLWLEVRGFAWQRRRKAAANIVMNVRRGVLRDLGIGEHLREVDPTWARSVPLSPTADLWRVLEARPSGQQVGPEEELGEVLSWAVSQRVIDEHDRELLVSLAAAADDAEVTRSRCGQAGLCSRQASRAVAARRGVSEATVRRHASRSVQALALAYAQIPA
jgi:hypothetical protein